MLSGRLGLGLGGGLLCRAGNVKCEIATPVRVWNAGSILQACGVRRVAHDKAYLVPALLALCLADIDQQQTNPRHRAVPTSSLYSPFCKLNSMP
jgi:hypothetical protein